MHAHTRKHNSHVLCRVLYNRAHDTIHREQPARQYHIPQLYYTHHDISNNVTDTCTLAAWGAPLCRLCLFFVCEFVRHLNANKDALRMYRDYPLICISVCVRISLKRSINNRRTFVKLFHILGPGAYYYIMSLSSIPQLLQKRKCYFIITFVRVNGTFSRNMHAYVDNILHPFSRSRLALYSFCVLLLCILHGYMYAQQQSVCVCTFPMNVAHACARIHLHPLRTRKHRPHRHTTTTTTMLICKRCVVCSLARCKWIFFSRRQCRWRIHHSCIFVTHISRVYITRCNVPRYERDGNDKYVVVVAVCCSGLSVWRYCGESV